MAIFLRSYFCFDQGGVKEMFTVFEINTLSNVSPPIICQHGLLMVPLSLFISPFIATRRNALCMTFCWFAFSMGYFGLIYNTPAFNWNIYLVFVFPTFVTIPTALSQPLFENKVGRKPIFTFSLLTAGKRRGPISGHNRLLNYC